jgi:hypothetical protein
MVGINPHHTWTIAQDVTIPKGGTETVYWARGGLGIGTSDWKPLGPPDEVSGTIRTFVMKKVAVEAWRAAFGRMPRSYRAVLLSQDEALLVRGDTATEDTAQPVIEPLPASEGVTQVAAAPAVPAATGEPEIRVGVTTDVATGKTAGIDLHYTGLDTPEHARDVDRRLRRQARHFDSSWLDLEAVIAEAKNWQIHTKLGFKSWPDYIADVARREMPNVARSVEQRRQVVALLAGEGMSQRAIADAVGVSNATVSRDQEVLHDVTPEAADEVLHDVTPEPATVTGRDGKSYPAKPKPKPDVPKPPVDMPDDQPDEDEDEDEDNEYELSNAEKADKLLDLIGLMESIAGKVFRATEGHETTDDIPMSVEYLKMIHRALIDGIDFLHYQFWVSL